MESSFSGSQKAEPAVTVANPRDEIVVRSKDKEEDLVSLNILHTQQELSTVLTKSVEEEDRVLSPEKQRTVLRKRELQQKLL